MKSIEDFIRIQDWPQNALQLPQLQAHRGYWVTGAQENTLPAFRAAKLKGAQMFECDVRLSADGIPIVFHDPKLERLYNVEQSIESLKASEIQKISSAPLLSEILQDEGVPRFINIEIKTQKSLLSPIVAEVVKVVQKAGAEQRVLFSSFNPVYIYQLAKLAKDIPRALLVTPDKGSGNILLLRKMWLAPLLPIHILHLDRQMLGPARIERLQRNKIPFAVWTVNETKEINFYLEAGAKSVISDTLAFP